MRRREFISLLTGTIAAWPLATLAQQPTLTIGFLNSASRDQYNGPLRAFLKGLAAAGYTEARDVAIEFRWAEGQYDRIPYMAAELVDRKVDVIVANGPAVLAAKNATTKIPIIFTVGFDPVAFGLVSNLSHPGDNLTGVSILNTELGPKRLELLHEMVPKAVVFALLVNPANPNAETLSQTLHASADTIGLQLHVFHAKVEADFEPIFARLKELRVDGLVIGTDPFFTTRAEMLATLTLLNKLPTIYQYPEFVAAGGLISYGASLTDTYYKAGDYTARVLKGAKPADLPVQQSTKVELTINLKTVKTLGLTVPLALLGRADEVIE
jgi:putative ABC transport system substrate-binding protein